ncbi:late transcription factor VLTF2 [Squirrelpox virus]|uniref:Viral late gene transcription factor 2 n=1 Tax=Squirrelpox virus TaxID=240426 RepID=U3UBJ7_9POXV|nr:late transcription factor VLTF2 [Squirrelpox virus]CCD83271.1 late transcription factor VLTF2 [Squirrelpox virus]
MAKRVVLSDVVISAPRNVYRPEREEALACVLPRYYRSVASARVPVAAPADVCWFCAQAVLGGPLVVETMNGGSLGAFCSRICRDSFAGMVRSCVALREEPKITLLPMVCYSDPAEVRAVVNDLRDREGVYGSCFLDEARGSVHISLRSLV